MTSCCACLASSAALRSNGCKVSPRSLHDDLARHLRVNRTEVRISSRFAESEGKLLVRIEHFGFEDAVRADHCVWNIVAIDPRYRCPHWSGQRRWAEAEVIDLHLCRFRLLLSACQVILLADGDCSNAGCQRYCQNCNRHTSPHAFSPVQFISRSDWFLDLADSGSRERRIDHRQRVLPLNVVHISNSQNVLELLRRHFHWPRRSCLARFRLRKCC